MMSLAVTLASALAVGPYVPDNNEYLADADLRAVGLERYWETDLPVEPGDGPVAATLRDEILYISTRQGNLVAMHAATGLTLWARELVDRGRSMLPPTHLWTPDGNGPTAVAAGRTIYVMDRLTGEPISEYELEFTPGASPVGDWESLFVPGFDGHMYALRWHGGRTGLAVQRWRVRTGGPLTSEAIFDGRTLYFASRDGTVHSCIGYSRILNWSYRTAGPVSANIVLDDDHILVASQDRSLYRLEAGTGLVVWQRRLPSPLEDSPVVAGQIVYQTAPGEGLFAVDLAGGELLWHLPEARAFVAGGGEVAYVLAADGNRLLAVDNRTGKVSGSMEINDTRVVASNPDSDAVYLFSSWNRVLCLRPADVPYLTLQEIAAVRNRISTGGTRLGSDTESAASTEADGPAALVDDPLRSRRDIAPVSGR